MTNCAISLGSADIDAMADQRQNNNEGFDSPKSSAVSSDISGLGNLSGRATPVRARVVHGKREVTLDQPESLRKRKRQDIEECTVDSNDSEIESTSAEQGAERGQSSNRERSERSEREILALETSQTQTEHSTVSQSVAEPSSQNIEMPDSSGYSKKGDKSSSGGKKGDKSSSGGRKSRENSAETENTTDESSSKRGRSRSGYN
ncbi:hypothetical protein JX265_001590 [Neoarthrinium moseri]|uniref:Uncharacterized protein n=1 Tax=Neoarthrinium moseri TaxID=1658444 RepID=A0A9P9WVC2_9PEZI|nr:uncharacterized protein JN550_003985 [Neoarthrinium moseri]KAI1844604.1 hypothetical protein JX266_009277 [Neoarthrinium moseri]KAI1872266.1 hypothetical protein JN550_003985 [Neoarthrinium moseri]KAI1879969.1 hypothetical protein JX265_001590 [Neoarthrinium moseri]